MEKIYYTSENWNLIKRALPVIFLALCLSVSGQDVQKKKLLPSEYSKWGSLNLIGISGDGKWVAYAMVHTAANDTLYLKNMSDKKQLVFPKGSTGTFFGENRFVFLSPGKRLTVINLSTITKLEIPDVTRYDILGKSGYMVTLGQHGVSDMQLYDKGRRILKTITNVSEYALSPDMKKLIYSSHDKGKFHTSLLDLKSLETSIVAIDETFGFDNLQWQRNSQAVTFFHKNDTLNRDNDVLVYYLQTKSLVSLNSIVDSFRNGKDRIVQDWGLSIADDGTKVFFGIVSPKENRDTIADDQVEIWNGNDAWIYPMEKNIGNWETSPKLSAWYIDRQIVLPISTANLPDIQLTGNQDYALLSNPKAYAPHYKLDGDVDYVMMDLNKQSLKSVVKEISGNPQFISLSPYSNAFAYYKEKAWWLYNPDKQSYVKLSGNAATQWDTEKSSEQPPTEPYGICGWSTDHKYVLIYDAYDIWAAALDGSSCKRLTHGKEKQLTFRLDQGSYAVVYKGRHFGKNTFTVDLSEEITLQAKGFENKAQGFFVWSGKNEKMLAYRESAIEHLQKSNNKSYVCIEQRFDLPPRILYIAAKNKPKVVFSGNRQQQNYEWGRSELITYKAITGEQLKAALYFPAGYDSKKKYPMVALVYEQKSKELHHYQNPSLLNSDGFNITNYTLNGYAVLLPDITYGIGSPGPSATACVTAAVEKVIDLGIADPDRIGLIGHSFGGYEANFIITQTNLFKAAVSGAGISDLTGWYFSIGGDVQAPQAWRFESQIFRMGLPFYEDRDNYLRNSPVYNAKTIKTPILLWAGKEDIVVPWEQGITFNMALRRLGKENIFLAYPKEGHSIENPGNQQDLSNRIQQWFDHYLKGFQAEEWIVRGTTLK